MSQTFDNFDEVKEALDAASAAEVKEALDAASAAMENLLQSIRQEMFDEIMDELSDALRGASAEDAPEIGTESAWGKDEAKGLQAFMTLLEGIEV